MHVQEHSFTGPRGSTMTLKAPPVWKRTEAAGHELLLARAAFNPAFDDSLLVRWADGSITDGLVWHSQTVRAHQASMPDFQLLDEQHSPGRHQHTFVCTGSAGVTLLVHHLQLSSTVAAGAVTLTTLPLTDAVHSAQMDALLSSVQLHDGENV